jgi:hypothetical protein
VVVTTGTAGLAAASIVSPLSTPVAQAAWFENYLPVGAFVTIAGEPYYMGTLNDLSQIVPGVSWQVNTERGVLLKGYGRVPNRILHWLLQTLGPIRAQ